MTDHHSTLVTIGESLAAAGFDPECLSRSPLDQPVGLYADALGAADRAQMLGPVDATMAYIPAPPITYLPYPMIAPDLVRPLAVELAPLIVEAVERAVTDALAAQEQE